MIGHKDWLSEIRPIKAVVKIDDGKVIQAEGIGEISLTTKNDNGKPCNITLQNVLYVPGLKANLFYIPRTVMYSKGTIIYHDKIIHIKPHRIESKTIAVGYYTSDVKLFILDCVVRLSEIIKTKCFIAQEIVKKQPAVFVSKAKKLLNIIDSKIPVQVETKSNHLERVKGEECRNLPTSDDDTTNEFTLKSLFKKQKLVPNKDTNVKLEKTLQRVKMTKKVAINSKKKEKRQSKACYYSTKSKYIQ